MGRRPNPLLQEFLDKELPLPEIDWQTVPLGVNPMDAWEMFDENVEGWVPIWFPVGDLRSGQSFTEFERAYFFNDDLERILKAMHRWPLWGNPAQKKEAVAIALLHLYCEVNGLCGKV
ncbi:MAG: hypothetical protein LJE89_04175 [Deltaproteobacteria bacterium]|nr:hypothetical protein [Deltaproteobacteria bacterium]